MPSYEEMMESVLDAGRECECCSMAALGCQGIIMGPKGPMFPACSSKDFSELLVPCEVERVYKEANAHD